MRTDRELSIEGIMSLIPIGEQNAVSMRYLAMFFNVEERDIRQAILDARLSGRIVCGTSYGYFFPADVAELRRYYRSAHNRAMTTLKSLKAARVLLRRIDETEEKEVL